MCVILQTGWNELTHPCLSDLNANNLVPGPGAEMGKVISANFFALQDIMSNLERLTNSPLPFGYQFHIRVTTWYVGS